LAAKRLPARVAEAMSLAFGAGTFREFLITYFDQEPEDYAAGGGISPYLAVAHRFNKERRLGELLDALCDARTTDVTFKKLKAEIEPLLTSADPFEDVLLFGQSPLLNRQPFREQTRRLALNTQPRLVVIHGDAKSGKSQSAWFLRHIQEARNAFKYHWIDLESEFRPSAEPDRAVTALDLAQAIDGRLGLGYKFATDPSKEPLKIQPFSNEFSRVLKSPERQNDVDVIVLDSFSKRKLEPSVHELIDALAVPFATEISVAFLVLLDYERRLPSLIEPSPYVYREKTEPLRDSAYIADFFRRVLGGTGQLAAVDADQLLQVAKAVNEATRDIDLASFTSMEILGAACGRLASRIKAGTWP
jgi:hypothetical protein